MKPKAVITGLAGQDGSYLAEFLLEKGYEVHGLVRRDALESPEDKLWRLQPFLSDLILHASSLDNPGGISSILAKVKPRECYHLAAHSFVNYSFEDDFAVMAANLNTTLFVLAAVREVVPECRFYFAGSSEMFGNAPVSPQNESTPFNPRTPYGISKLAGFHVTKTYRDAHRLFACTGILFNHESPRRGLEYVTRKISHAAARISLGRQSQLRLGNLDALRDWGHSADYVRAMWLMLQQDRPDDYVVASGVAHTVREFAETAFREVGLDWKKFVCVDPQLYRSPETRPLTGDSSKSRTKLGWAPSVSFEELVSIMVQADLKEINRRSAACSNGIHGFARD
ncbi:MAG: GDP-mannose 4,6-dehydratase [Desulfomonile tiedjei]|nr:GDP-mannose 4,6-dehydratase [Desulfomonile tiedjei]